MLVNQPQAENLDSVKLLPNERIQPQEQQQQNGTMEIFCGFTLLCLHDMNCLPCIMIPISKSNGI